MDQMWSWPSFSFSPSMSKRFQDIPEPMSNRFQDIPPPIRGKIVKAATDAMRESLEEVAKEIQILSLDDNSNAPENLKLLTAKVEAAERLGFDVKEYKERLAELESILDEWKEKKDCLVKANWGMIYARMEMFGLQYGEQKELEAVRECTSVFENIASAPWHRKDDPVKEKEGLQQQGYI